MESISASQANQLARNGRLGEGNAPKGSIASWRNKHNTGGSPFFNGRLQDKVFQKDVMEGIVYCQCKFATVDSGTHKCTKCENYFDPLENKKLVEYKMIGV